MKPIFNTIFLITMLQLSAKLFASGISSISYENIRTIDQNAPALDNNLFSINLNLDEQRPTERTKLAAAIRFYSESSNAIFSIPEAYIEYKFADVDYTLGRKIIDWNGSEKFWLLGNINGRKNFSLLSDEQEGLTGFHASRRVGKNFSIDLIGSYFYIPNMNPSYEVIDGKITSKAQWVSLPPSQIALSGQMLPIRYYLDTPRVDKILIQETLAIRLNYKNLGTKASVYGLYKPENDLRINAEGYLSRTLDEVKVTAHPFVNHHVVVGASLQQKLSTNWKLFSGVEMVDPNADIKANLLVVNPSQMAQRRQFDADYFSIVPVYAKKSYFYAGVENSNPIHRLSFNSIVLLSEDKNPGDDFYGDQVKWRKAVGGSYQYFHTDKLSFNANVKYDLELLDNIFTAESIYQFSEDYRLKFGVELIKAPSLDSYWSVYRSNDTIFGDFSVLF